MAYTIYLLQFMAFLDLLAVGLIVPLVANHVKELGGSHIYVGLMGSFYSGNQLFSGPIMGALSDIKGRQNVLIATLLVSSIGYLTMGYTTSIIFLLFLRILLGIFKQTQMLTKALVPDYEKDERQQSVIYGKLAAISGAGITLGPVIGGHIMEDLPNTGFSVVASMAALLFVLNAGLASFLPSVKKQKHKPVEKLSPKTFLQITYTSLKQSILEIYNIEWSVFWEPLLFKALVGFCMGVYYSSNSLFLKTRFDLTPKYIGYTISFQGVIGSLCSFLIAYVNSFYKTDSDYTQRNLHCFLLMFISLVGLAISLNIYVYVLWLIPLAICNAVGRLITLEMILKRSSGQHRGTLIGASNSVRSLSGVVAPMVAGFVGDYFGMQYVLNASIISALLGLVVSYRVRRKSRGQGVKVD